LLYARVTSANTNHTPIREYCLRFFSKENFNCLYKIYPIKSRCHILHECRKYIRILIESLLAILLCFWSIILGLFPFMKKLLNSSITIIILILYCLLFPFLFSFLFLFFSFAYISSYIIATIVYHHVLYNKLLIQKKLSYNIIQENSIEFLLQHSLSYILLGISLCILTLTYLIV